MDTLFGGNVLDCRPPLATYPIVQACALAQLLPVLRQMTGPVRVACHRLRPFSWHSSVGIQLPPVCAQAAQHTHAPPSAAVLAQVAEQPHIFRGREPSLGSGAASDAAFSVDLSTWGTGLRVLGQLHRVRHLSAARQHEGELPDWRASSPALPCLAVMHMGIARAGQARTRQYMALLRSLLRPLALAWEWLVRSCCTDPTPSRSPAILHPPSCTGERCPRAAARTVPAQPSHPALLHHLQLNGGAGPPG